MEMVSRPGRAVWSMEEGTNHSSCFLVGGLTTGILILVNSVLSYGLGYILLYSYVEIYRSSDVLNDFMTCFVNRAKLY